jgi:hypothetical protein
MREAAAAALELANGRERLDLSPSRKSVPDRMADVLKLREALADTAE